MSLTLTAPAFADGASIPQKYTCDGENVSPELHIGNAPEGTQSFVLVMDDPDIPVSVKQARGIDTFDHWVVFNIPGDTTVIPEGGLPNVGSGMNTRGTNGYTGPCPPDKEHRYFFRLYAVSGTLNFIKAPTLHEVEAAAQGMALGQATLTGRYERARE
jgi:Raf kinase inhibitor-like YbhB/YbcL family protein